MGNKATLIEIFKRYIKLDNSEKKIYTNGKDNLYPNSIERVINNSPSAKRCALMMAKYIAGLGLTNPESNVIINAKKNYKITDIISKIALNFSYQYGAFIHIGYGLDETGIIPKNLDVLDYLKCRISKEDDGENKGKIYYKDYENNSVSYFGSTKDECWFYPYNRNQNVIIEQIKNDFELAQKKVKNKKNFSLEEAIKTFRGQVYYLNLSPYIYALSPADSVFNDADTESRISIYMNTQVRLGFMGKTMIITKGLDSEIVSQINKDFGVFIGAENSGSIYHLAFDSIEDINNVVRVEQLKPAIDDDLFTKTTKRLRTNILGAFNNIPEALVFSGEGALFGTSGDTYREMKKFYSEQTSEERKKIEEMLEMLGYPCQIEPIAK